jgi:hypothetical protein
MAKIIESPLDLKSKVSGSGAISAEMLARADSAIAEIAVEYPSLALQDIDELAALVETAASDQSQRDRWIEQIYEASDEIRGLGTMFNYPLITSIADSLCSITEHAEVIDEKGIEIARAHLEAMHAVIVNKVTGDENEIGQQIASALETAVNKHAEFTGLLVSVDNPDGSTLEDILTEIRKSVLMRCTKMVHDRRPSIQHVLRNNQKILRLLDNAISYARDSTQTIGGEDK